MYIQSPNKSISIPRVKLMFLNRRLYNYEMLLIAHMYTYTFVQEFGWNGSLYGIVSESINNRAIKLIMFSSFSFLVLGPCLENHEPVVNFL